MKGSWSGLSSFLDEMRKGFTASLPSSQLSFRSLPLALGPDRLQIPPSRHRCAPSVCRRLTMQNAPCSDQDPIAERVKILFRHPSISSVAGPIDQPDSELPPIAAPASLLLAADSPPAPTDGQNLKMPITVPQTQHQNVHSYPTGQYE